MENKLVHCILADQCSGCSWINIPYDLQLQKKQTEISEILKTLESNIAPVIHSSGPRAGRTRLDLTLETQDGNSRLGLYGLNRQGIVDMLECPMATPELEAWLKDLKKEKLPQARKGSLRLRISPTGQRGLWIDFSNEDIKALLGEATWLEKMSKHAVIEIGQRNKRLIKKDGRFKLGEPEFAPWFETYLGEELKAHPIYLPISGFTQTGFSANKLLIQTALSMMNQISATEVLELFCGSGNFTLAMASRGLDVTAIELDAAALEGLEKSLKELGLDSKVTIKRKDLYRIPKEELSFPVWFVDPPRSGLKSVVDRLAELSEAERPKHLIYVSCFLQSWADDSQKLKALGYKLSDLQGVDQFPNTPHCEWISRFSL